MASDASHIMDLARMAMGDPNHPNSGAQVLFDDERGVPDIQAITYDFGDYTMSCISSKFGDYMLKSNGEVRHGNKFPEWNQYGTRIEIYGTEGIMYLGRHGGGWQVLGNNREVVAEEYGIFPDVEQKNFIDSIRTRKIPNAEIKQGHKSATLVHMANLAYRVGNKKLLFNNKTELFISSTEANELVILNYRSRYKI